MVVVIHILAQMAEPMTESKTKQDWDNVVRAHDGLPMDDDGNAERLVKVAADRLRYVHAWGKFMVWRTRTDIRRRTRRSYLAFPRPLNIHAGKHRAKIVDDSAVLLRRLAACNTFNDDRKHLIVRKLSAFPSAQLADEGPKVHGEVSVFHQLLHEAAEVTTRSDLDAMHRADRTKSSYVRVEAFGFMQTVRKRRHHVTLDADYGLLLAFPRGSHAAQFTHGLANRLFLMWKRGPKSSGCPLLQRHQAKY